MPQPIKSNKQGKNPNESDMAVASNNLWVGNLGGDVTDSDLRGLFEKHGTVDSITSYPSRSYAFVYFKRPDEAKLAKDSLQGTVLHGNALKIEFAKPAKPCKSLWVSGINSAVSKEELEEEFSTFGKIEDFKFLRDRNTAYVDYLKLEDASEALKGMNGKRIGGAHIRVDYLRSHSRRDNLPDGRETREGQFVSRSMGPHDSPWIPQDFLTNYPDSAHYGSKRQQHSQSSGGQKGDGEPNNVLKISYPPSVHVDEQMLHNAMILFGEIERIRSFPSRQCSFVEFRSVEEAQRAKEGLQGQLFNDPRISIMFLSSDLASNNDFSGFHPGINGPRPGVFLNENPFQHSQMDVYGQNCPAVPSNFHGRLPPRVVGPDMPMRPLAPPGSFEALPPGSDFSDSAILHKLPDTNPITVMGGPNWRRSSPTPGMHASPSAGMKPSTRPLSGPWDVFDGSQLQREPKRSRTDGTLPFVEMNDRLLGPDQAYRVSPQVDEGALASLTHVQRNNHLSLADSRFTTRGTDLGHPELDYVWRGVIAKGGTPVCRARCVPLGEWIGYEIPEVVNCSARTGLDMLAKHYADAVGFDIIFFLPDSEEDFASYTEFLRYLGDKNRAGVAKFDDGTTLFLVPPSDFLSRVLNVAGPERLYGVVLKFPQYAPSTTSMHPQSGGQPQFIDKLQIPPRNDYSVMPQEERVLQVDYNRVLQEEAKPPPKLLGLATSSPRPAYLGPPVISTSTPPPGLSLTPELIATLSSLLPPKESNSHQPSGSTVLRPASASAVSDRGPPQGCDYERQTPEQVGHFLHQAGDSLNHQPQNLPQHQAYPSISNSANNFGKPVVGSNQIQELTFSLPEQGAISSTPGASFTTLPQTGHFAVPLGGSQQYRPEILQDPQRGYGMEHRTEAFGQFTSPMLQPPSNTVTSSSQVHGVNVYQPQSVVPMAVENSNSEIPNQVHQLHSALYGAGQGTSEVDADKNERYRSTLQFAANLLLQIQQQQQPDTQARQGAGNH